MITRPSNHVTRELESRRAALGQPEAGPSGSMPVVSADFVEWLKANFPPRCMYPGEGLEAHMAYSGKVALSETIISNHEISLRDAADLLLDPDLDDGDIADVFLQRLDRQQAELRPEQLRDGSDEDADAG